MTLEEKFPIGTRVAINGIYRLEMLRNKLFGVIVGHRTKIGRGYTLVRLTSPTPERILSVVESRSLCILEKEITIINPVLQVDKDYEDLYV